MSGFTEAVQALDILAHDWYDTHPHLPQSCLYQWADITTLLDFPPAIRRAIYTTNAIESVTGVMRTFTKNRKNYPNEQSALKLIHMAFNETSKKWSQAIHYWKQALNHFAIIYQERMPNRESN